MIKFSSVCAASLNKEKPMKKPKRSNDLANLAIPSDRKTASLSAERLLDRLNEQQARVDKLTQQSPLFKSMNEQMERMEKLTRENPMMQKLNEQMQTMEKLTKISPAAQSILDQVDEQRRRLEAITGPNFTEPVAHKEAKPDVTPLRVPRMPIIKNPILDTNKKLSDIEQKFDSMLDVMANAAQIGNEIQAQAATFIDKFEEASDKTDKSAKQAIKVGYIALLISVVTLLSPWVQNLIWPDPVEQKIERLTSEIISSRNVMAQGNSELLKALEDTDEQGNERLINEIRKGQDQNNAALRELINLLSKPVTPLDN
jgi:hypothetical protein